MHTVVNFVLSLRNSVRQLVMESVDEQIRQSLTLSDITLFRAIIQCVSVEVAQYVSVLDRPVTKSVCHSPQPISLTVSPSL